MHGFDAGVLEDAAVIGVGLRHAEFGGECLGLFDLRLADSLEIDEAQAANAFEVDAADEAGAEQRGLDLLHEQLLFGEGIIYRNAAGLGRGNGILDGI